ncbi:MAG: Hemagglutinin/hemolysin-related protein [Myxococcaceae bacterium]|nr:Hemagglutinin/hemolysin-related protein [Myxococcaceae bacterium]
MKRGLWFGVVSLLVCAACGSDPEKTVQLSLRNECTDRPDAVLCSEGSALTCRGGKVSKREVCGSLVCVDAMGCRACEPGSTTCDGSKRSVCSADGSALAFVEECALPKSCAPFGCLDLCAHAVTDRSYLGCDYWPVFTSNSLLDPLFAPAVAIGNGNLVSAHVVITKNRATVTELDVAAGSAQTVQLSFDAALRQPGGSRLVRQGAYHLTSSVPVTVHQYNPLLFEVEQDCANKDDEPMSRQDDGKCNSYTNDASLLFPSTALKQDPEFTDSKILDFVALSRGSYMQKNDSNPAYAGQGGFVAVVAVGDAPANVTVTSAAFTLASPAGADEPVELLRPGQSLVRTLSPGDVLQLTGQVPSNCSTGRESSATLYPDHTVFCDPGSSYDLTGTQVSADGPVQVISGHDCANVTFERVACDHLEESMVPLHAWGTSAVVTVPESAAGSHYVLRLVSGADANTVTFDPPINPPVTLAKYQSFEFTATQSTFVRGTGRLMVAQYLMGQYNLTVGDPAMGVAVPVDQYRLSYNFVSPSTYVRNYVDIIAAHDDVVTLDGKLVGAFTPIGTSKYSTASVELTVPGAHEIHGLNPVGLGIVLYGLAPYTAYLLPGGLDLYPIETIGI